MTDLPASTRPADSATRPRLSQVVAENVRAYRFLRRLTQDQLGDRMTALRLDWNGGTVGFVERRDRAVNVDELCGLAVALGVTIGQLLDPTGPDQSQRRPLDVGLYDLPDGTQSIAPWSAQLWANSRMVIRAWVSEMFMDLVYEPAPSLHPLADRELAALLEAGEVRPLDAYEERA